VKGVLVQQGENNSEVDIRTAERIADAPLPTASTLRKRQNPAVQLWRFARINLKMMRIIAGGHE
jgi:hypothetical protein